MDESRRSLKKRMAHFFYRKNKTFDVDYIADILQRTLACEAAQLWDMLLSMTAASKCGMQMFHIQGLVGSGKTTGIRVFWCAGFSPLQWQSSDLFFAECSVRQIRRRHV